MNDKNNKLLAQIRGNLMNYAAIINKGEKQFVTLCPELDVVSQGYTIEMAAKKPEAV